MSYDFGSGVWYGELRATKGNTTVIRDDELPEANKGRIYLYNTERDAIIQYDENIVCEKLFPLDAEQAAQAKAEYQSQWEAAKKALVGRSRKPSANQETPAKAAVAELLPTDDDDTLDDDDD